MAYLPFNITEEQAQHLILLIRQGKITNDRALAKYFIKTYGHDPKYTTWEIGEEIYAIIHKERGK